MAEKKNESWQKISFQKHAESNNGMFTSEHWAPVTTGPGAVTGPLWAPVPCLLQLKEDPPLYIGWKDPGTGPPGAGVPLQPQQHTHTHTHTQPYDGAPLPATGDLQRRVHGLYGSQAWGTEGPQTAFAFECKPVCGTISGGTRCICIMHPPEGRLLAMQAPCARSPWERGPQGGGGEFDTLSKGFGRGDGTPR